MNWLSSKVRLSGHRSESINSLLLIGWSTACLIAASIRVGPFNSGKHF
ncbi:hypothetical protein [Oricola cellulosilytica]|nr:hypothetical protein [Oricola cellulosilytica]